MPSYPANSLSRSVLEQPDVVPAPGKRIWRIGTLQYTKAGLITLSSWLLWGDFAWSIRDRSVGTIFQLLLRKFKASDTVAGVLIGTLPAAIGLLLGPVISYRSDQHRSRSGRRRPFLLASAPVAAVAIVGLGFSPWMGHCLHWLLGAYSPGLYPSVLLILALWWIVFDLATTVTNNVHDYRLTYLAGTVLSVMALCCLLMVDLYWRRLGRPAHFPL